MTDDGRHADGRSPSDMLRVLWERRLLVLAAVVACVGAAAAVTLTAEKKYTSSAELLVRDPGFARTLFGADLFEGGADPERDTSTTISVIDSPQVTERVRRRLGGGITAEELRSSVSVSAGDNSDLLTIEATTSSPALSARTANAYATEYIKYVRELDRRKVRDAKRLVARSFSTASEVQRRGLRDSLKQLTVLEALQTGNADVIARARPSPEASSPKPVQAGAIAGALGLLLGAMLAFMADLVDRRLKTVEAFERILGQPVLVSIPHGAVPRTALELNEAKGEPYRMLREGLHFLEGAGDARCLLFTSAGPGEGKTTVALNLALAIAMGGERVILIEADLRQPTVRLQLGIAGESPGLAAALTSERPLEDLLLDVSRGGAVLKILPSGVTPVNPADLLRRDRLAELIAEARRMASVVIIDAPPLLPVSDTRVLLDVPLIDGALLVGRANWTRRDDAGKALRVLRQSERRLLGVVVTDTNEPIVDYYDDPIEGKKARRRRQHREATALPIRAERPR